MATLAGHEWASQAAISPRSPDNTSSVYPHRPIRPLPRRRLRSRLSIEEAGSITFPPLPPSSPSLFGSPRNMNDRSAHMPHYPGADLHDDHDHDHGHHDDHVCDCGGDHSLDSEEEAELKEEAVDRPLWQARMAKYPRELAERMVHGSKPPQPKSSTSSADGYESFENTNNKKKRKIPLPGTFGDTSPIDGSSMSIPTQSVDVSVPDRGYHQYGSAGVGISGAGRGRNSRTTARYAHDRRPLGASTNGLNAISSGKWYPETVSRTSYRFDYGLRRSLTYPLDHAEQQGIISAAIANAAENRPLGTATGQENVSLLQRQPPASEGLKDFTFEYPSDSAHKMGRAPPLPPQTSRPVVSSQRGPPTGLPPHNPNQSYPPNPQGNQYPSAQQAAPPPRPRRPGHALRMAAQQRKEQQMYNNRVSPPKREDMYICEFCEYESIYGRPPAALIRQYEIKDRRERKAKEINRRRLEKMKAKGRKNRKGARGAAKNPPTTPSGMHQPPYDPRYDPPEDDDSQEEEEEDFFEDGYDDTASLPSHLDPVSGVQPPYRNPGRRRSYDDYEYAHRNYPPPPLEVGGR